MGEPAREGARHGRPRRAGASCVDRGPRRADERRAGGPATTRKHGSPASAGGSARRGGGRLDELDEYPTGVLGVNEVDPAVGGAAAWLFKQQPKSPLTPVS